MELTQSIVSFSAATGAGLGLVLDPPKLMYQSAYKGSSFGLWSDWKAGKVSGRIRSDQNQIR